MNIENLESTKGAESKSVNQSLVDEINGSRQSFVREQAQRTNESSALAQFGTPEIIDSGNQSHPGDRSGNGLGQNIEPRMTPIGDPVYPVQQQLRTVPKERDQDIMFEDCMKMLYQQNPVAMGDLFGTNYDPLHQRVRRNRR